VGPILRILIGDDHSVVRRGLKNILEEAPDIRVTGEARDAHETLNMVRRQNWDLVVLDLTMPGKSGLEVLKEIKEERPRLPVLILSVHSEDQYAVRVLKAGASGYLTKEMAPEQLMQAVRRVLSGRKYVSPSLAEKLALNLESPSDRPPHELLSDREYQVLCLIASGKAAKEIASELSLSVKTVSTYRSRILEKMRLKNNAELIHYAISHGLVD